MSEAVERYREIEAHLSFQKSIIDDEDDGERLSRYLSILEDVKNGIDQSNPVDREIARILSLAVNEDFDPWEIDLVEFSRAYMEEIRRSEDVDFMVAGRILFLSWSVLKKQSDATLSKAEGMEEEEFFFEDWAPWEFEPYENIDDISYTDRVVESDDPPIKKAVRYRTRRKVTLIELVDAFEEVRKEVEFREKIEKIRKKAVKDRVKVPNVEHKEDIEEEIKEVWKRICEHKGTKLTLSDIFKGDREDLITVFVAILFLAHRNRIRIWQDGPYGEIHIENIMPRDENGNFMEPPVIFEETEKEESQVNEQIGEQEELIISV